MVQGLPLWAYQVDTTDLRCLCDLMIMMQCEGHTAHTVQPTVTQPRNIPYVIGPAQHRPSGVVYIGLQRTKCDVRFQWQ